MKPYVPEEAVEITYEGKRYAGRYRVERGVLTVRSGFATRRTQLGGSPPESLARLLLSEIVRAGEASPVHEPG